jgi:hypothetical protein
MVLIYGAAEEPQLRLIKYRVISKYVIDIMYKIAMGFPYIKTLS